MTNGIVVTSYANGLNWCSTIGVISHANAITFATWTQNRLAGTDDKLISINTIRAEIIVIGF